MGKMKSRGKSSSSKNINQKGAKSEQVKEKEPVNKKLKQSVATNTQEIQNETTINDLPTEMLMKILKLVDTKNLVPCRLVNGQWLEISTEILCTRGEIELHFGYNEGTKIFVIANSHNLEGRRSLGDFIECFKEPKNCFYTRFLFVFYVFPPPSKFENEDWIKFIPFIKDKIKCLRLAIAPACSNDVPPLSESLRHLLLNKLPRLEEFGLTFVPEPTHRPYTSQVQLFPSKTEPTATTMETKSGTTKETTTTLTSVQLPHLKVLHLGQVLFSACPRIVDDLLEAAVNLKSIKNFGEHHYSDWRMCLRTEDYNVLHSKGKLDLLEEAQMTPSVELFSALKENTHLFKLKKLALQMKPIYKEEEEEEGPDWEDVSIFMSHLFESSKDTLSILMMEPIGFLPHVKLPRFSKLETLIVPDTSKTEIFKPVFPSGINSLDFFPVVHTLVLEVDWKKNFPGEDKIPRIPTVQGLFVTDWNLNAKSIEKMSLMCPNVKDFIIRSAEETDHLVNFMEVGRVMWTHMSQLESLHLQINMDNLVNTYHALDSCFTGISIENCKRLYELTRAEKYLKRWGSQANIPKAEFETPARENVSILDLKDLKNLIINIQWHTTRRICSDDLLKRALTSVSETYAFKVKENLNYKIEHHKLDNY